MVEKSSFLEDGYGHIYTVWRSTEKEVINNLQDKGQADALRKSFVTARNDHQETFGMNYLEKRSN